MGMMQVGPNEAEINLCKWVKLVWVAEDKCLAVPNLDTIAWVVAVGGIVLTLVLLFSARRKTASAAKPNVTKFFLGKSWSPPPEFVSLIEVATDALRLTKDTALFGFARGSGTCREDQLAFYAGILRNCVQIYGLMTPSPGFETIDGRKNLHFKVVGNEIHSFDGTQKPLWLNLHIKKNDVSRAIDCVKMKAKAYDSEHS